MLEWLAELIEQVWEDLKLWEIVYEYDDGIILRFGKFSRRTHTGINWKWPFIEDILTETAVTTTMPLRAQSLTTNDGKAVVISSIVKYQIKDVKPYKLDIWDSADVLRDVTMGAIKDVISVTPLDRLLEQAVEKQVLDQVRKEVNPYGFKIQDITFVDCAMVKSLRLISNPDEYDDSDE